MGQAGRSEGVAVGSRAKSFFLLACLCVCVCVCVCILNCFLFYQMIVDLQCCVSFRCTGQ